MFLNGIVEIIVGVSCCCSLTLLVLSTRSLRVWRLEVKALGGRIVAWALGSTFVAWSSWLLVLGLHDFV